MSLAGIASGQIMLEHSYPNASNYYQMSTSGVPFHEMYIVRLEVDGEKYAHIDNINKQVIFYNLDHSPFKTVSFAGATQVNTLGNSKTILYISQHLFDTDDEVEFMYVDAVGYGSAVTQIINEDGSVLFTASSQAPLPAIHVPQAQVFVYNTAAGTKMILSEIGGGNNSQVYSLPGHLSAVTVKDIKQPESEQNMFPNPSSGKITISSPGKPVRKVNVTDASGKLVDSFTTGETQQLDLDVSSFASGQYIIQILDKNGKLIGTKKLIKE